MMEWVYMFECIIVLSGTILTQRYIEEKVLFTYSV